MVRPRVLCIFGGLLFLLLIVGPTALFVLLLIAITFIFGFVVFLIRDGVGIKQSLERTHANWVNEFRFPVRGQWDAFARGCSNPFSDEFIYAEKHSMTNSELLDPLLEEILDNIMRDYVDSWYNVQLSDDKLLRSSLKRTARRTIIALKTCLSKVDWATLLTRHIVDDFASHLRLYRKAKERLQFQKEFADRTDDLESVFFDLELEMERSYCRDLVSTSPAYESAYLHDICDVLLYLLMPSEDFRSRPLRFLIREILVSSVFVPLLDRLSEPSVVNRMIVWLISELPISTEDFVASIEACKSVQELEAVMESVHEEMNSLRSKGASLQRENGSIFSQQLASLEFTENIIKRRMTVLANWSTTAAESANSNQNWPLPKLNNSFDRSIGSEFVDDMDHSNSSCFVYLPITVVLTNTVALSHFVEFLNQVGGQSYIDFYLAIEGFNVSMEHQLRGLASGDTLDTDARETIREAALFMYHQYLSQEAITRVPLSEAIINKFLARLRNDEPSDGWFEQIQEKVVDILKSEDRFYPAFMKHALYSRMLVELDIITDACAVDTESNGSAAFVADEAVEEASVGSLSGASLAEDEQKLMPSTFDGSGGVTGTRHHRLQQNNCRASPAANDGTGTSVLVAMLGVGHQGKQLFALYNVRVHRTSDCARGGSSSNVLRRYSDFHSLHNFIIAKFPNLRTLSFPGKKTFNNLDQSFLEKRCKALNQYMHCIMQPSLLAANPGLEPLVFDFLTQKRVKAFGSAAVAMPSDLMDGIGKMGSELNRAASNVFKGASVNKQASFARVQSNSSSTGNLSDSARVAAHLDENDSVESIPLRVLLLLVDEVFGLRAKNQWFRRRLVSLLRQFIHAAMGQSINRRIIDAVNWLTSEEQVAQYLAAFRDSFWADSGGGSSSLADNSPQLDSQKTRFLARFLMLSAVPEELRLFVGSSTVQSGVETVSEALQNRHLNRRLCYVVLERLLVTCFPKNHFNRLLPQLHSKSPRAAM
uniref:Sorting nexin-13 n=1 Tax=Globodera pallida TaxID=36090 RepID=A0A183C4E6_GLOPA